MSLLINPYAFGGAITASDPYFANVDSLAHFDGTNGSATMPDQIGGAYSPAPYNARLSTAQARFGSASVLIPGTANDVVAHTVTSRTITSSSLYTLEFSVYMNSLSGLHGLCNAQNGTGSSNQGINIYHNGTSILCDDGNAGGTGPGFGTVSTGQWYDLALVADGTNTKSYIGAAGSPRTLQNTYAGVTGAGFTVAQILLGAFQSSLTTPASCYIDEIRWTWGIARTVTGALTAAFPDS